VIKNLLEDEELNEFAGPFVVEPPVTMEPVVGQPVVGQVDRNNNFDGNNNFVNGNNNFNGHIDGRIAGGIDTRLSAGTQQSQHDPAIHANGPNANIANSNSGRVNSAHIPGRANSNSGRGTIIQNLASADHNVLQNIQNISAVENIMSCGMRKISRDFFEKKISAKFSNHNDLAGMFSCGEFQGGIIMDSPICFVIYLYHYGLVVSL
jgi:hypothetical protein